MPTKVPRGLPAKLLQGRLTAGRGEGVGEQVREGEGEGERNGEGLPEGEALGDAAAGEPAALNSEALAAPEAKTPAAMAMAITIMHSRQGRQVRAALSAGDTDTHASRGSCKTIPMLSSEDADKPPPAGLRCCIHRWQQHPTLDFVASLWPASGNKHACLLDNGAFAAGSYIQ